MTASPIARAACLLAVALSTLGAWPPQVLAQAPAPPVGGIVVSVRDVDGVIPGAAVSAAPGHAPQSPVAFGTPDDTGVATLEGLAPGAYTVRVTFAGFAEATRTDVAVSPEGPTPLEVTLSVAQFAAEVTVTTANRREQVLLDVADPIVLIDEAQIADTGARTAKDLLSEQTGAGIQVQAGGGQGHLSLNGIPNSGVLVLIDGRRYLGKDANGNLNLDDLPLTGLERVALDDDDAGVHGRLVPARRDARVPGGQPRATAGALARVERRTAGDGGAHVPGLRGRPSPAGRPRAAAREALAWLAERVRS